MTMQRQHTDIDEESPFQYMTPWGHNKLQISEFSDHVSKIFQSAQVLSTVQCKKY